jgi:hypothetical protein
MCRSYEQIHNIRYLVEEEKPFDLEACFGKGKFGLTIIYPQ